MDRIIGFEGLGNGDKFTTKDLESRLLSTRVLVRSKLTDGHGSGNPLGWGRKAKSEERTVEDDDEECDNNTEDRGEEGPELDLTKAESGTKKRSKKVEEDLLEYIQSRTF